MTSVEESYQACRHVVRHSGSNFPWAFYVLPREKHRAMDALYAFARRTDDIGDENDDLSIKREQLNHWRQDLQSALSGDAKDPLLPALANAVKRFQIPERHLFEIIDGVEKDLSPTDYATFDQLRDYCYLVASSVGLSCVHIWGYTSDEVFAPAIECGVAFQLTNIVRDLREDAQRGRVYLPHEDFVACGISRKDLLHSGDEEKLRPLLELQFARLEELYAAGSATRKHLTPDGRRVFSLLFGTYHSLYRKLQRSGLQALRQRVRLSFGHKLAVAARCFLGAMS